MKWGLAEKNYIEGSRRFGVSIGHHDTDNVVRDNDIRASGQVGVLFRLEPEAGFQGNRNRIEGNRIVGIGSERGIGIDVQGQTQSITIARNEIREMEGPRERVGIRIGAEADRITLAENRIEGFLHPMVDLRSRS